MSNGERPMGAAKGKRSDTEALCHPPPFFRVVCSLFFVASGPLSLLPAPCGEEVPYAGMS